ncbi:peptidase C26 family protein [Mycobacterium ulcerans str. Harvey]|uniref:Peptidase C26 family protein n=1 Tax=Mycobacterium ulcerans str. Harvey TaxID=1299332 RepID=A0ABN0QZL6_MYCUL|nr:peptidase C26 family protein [Mycobacterium ulcerans str. Harvey]
MTTYLDQAKTGVWDVSASFLPASYFDGVTMAGGIAVLLPPQRADADAANRVLDSLDALVITGGKDVDPAAYGQQAHPATDEPAPIRDSWEFALLRGALQRGYRCSVSAAALKFSTSHSVGRCTSTCPMCSGTTDTGQATRCFPRCRCVPCPGPGWRP